MSVRKGRPPRPGTHPPTQRRWPLPRRPRRVFVHVLLMQLTVLTGVTAVATGLFLAPLSEQLDEQAMDRALSVAQTTAADPDLSEQLRTAGRPDPEGPVQQVAERIRRSTEASYVVVLDQQGLRWSHPEPKRVGNPPSTDPSKALAGEEVRHIDNGTLGRSARGKAPVRDKNGEVVGAVSAGIAYDGVRERLLSALPELLAYAGGALGVGALATLLISRRLQKRTHDLAFSDISALLAERNAMLHGIREGVVALDAHGRIRLVNDEAQRLLGLTSDDSGRTAEAALGPGRTSELLSGHVTGQDLLTVSGDRVLLANRMPTDDGGAVATFRDRTELELLGRELDGSHGLIDALRAQDHEHANRMHILLGLLQLELYDEAVEYLSNTVGTHRTTAEEISERVHDPLLGALLVGKATVAAERGVTLRLSAATLLPDRLVDPRELATVLGNLVDNALDAATGSQRATVEVGLSVRTERQHTADGAAHDSLPDTPPELSSRGALPKPESATGSTSAPAGARPTEPAHRQGVVLRVGDSGQGVPPQRRELIFSEGWSTKEPPSHGKRGLGLALVKRLAERHGGSAQVGESAAGGAEFTVLLPEALHPPGGAASG